MGTGQRFKSCKRRYDLRLSGSESKALTMLGKSPMVREEGNEEREEEDDAETS